jgi:hypothetical protein
MTLAGDYKSSIILSTHKIASSFWLKHCDCDSEAKEYKGCRKEELHVARLDGDGLGIIESWVAKLCCFERRPFGNFNFAIVLRYGVVKSASYIFRQTSVII